MKTAGLIFVTIVSSVWCDNTMLAGEPLSSPILTFYPCHGTKDIVIWYDPGLPPKERNQYYLYVNKLFLSHFQLETKFNAFIHVILNIKVDDKTLLRYALKNNERVEHRYNTQNPNQVGFGYKIKGNAFGKVPYLTSLKINNLEYCNQPNVGFLDQYVYTTIDTDTQLNCGRRKIEHTELIVNGNPTKPGDWPWHTAIYKFDYPTIKYICGGTLLSTHFVLTAAHCAAVRGTPVLADILSVVLGKYNLFGGDIGSVEKEVHQIILHEKFQYRYLHNDIALLKLKTEVVFTDYIQPACLWYSKANEKIMSHEIVGTVVGWGFDSSDTLSRTIRQAHMPMVADDVCMKSNPHFYTSILNDNKFCAGYRNLSSPCNGDSGSAFQVFIPDTVGHTTGASNSGTWLVRGIVSLTLSRTDAAVCDPEQYVVFTDVEKYLTWINNHLNDD